MPYPFFYQYGVSALCALTFCISATAAHLAPLSAPVRLCFQSEDAYPYSLKNGSGIMLDLLHTVASRLDIAIRFSAMPWKRCLAETAAGSQDGVVGTFYSAEQGKALVFPAKAESNAASTFRLGEEIYYVYRNKANPVDWDGMQFFNLKGYVGTLAGHLALPILDKMGVASNSDSVSVTDLLKKLDRDLVAAAILPGGETSRQIHLHANYQERIERLEKPFLVRQQFLAFSKKFNAKNPEITLSIWKEIANTRKLPCFQKIQAGYPL